MDGSSWLTVNSGNDAMRTVTDPEWQIKCPTVANGGVTTTLPSITVQTMPITLCTRSMLHDDGVGLTVTFGEPVFVEKGEVRCRCRHCAVISCPWVPRSVALFLLRQRTGERPAYC